MYMTNEHEKQRITIYIDGEARTNLKIIALRKGESMSSILAPAIDKIIKENEEYLI